MKHFSLHVNSMFVNKLMTRKLNKTNKNLQFKSKSIFTKNNANRQSWLLKGSWQITSQHENENARPENAGLENDGPC